jgi:hypothetical protein
MHGVRAVLVHAKDDDAKGFYAHFDFERRPSDFCHLLLIMKDVLKNTGKYVCQKFPLARDCSR